MAAFVLRKWAGLAAIAVLLAFCLLFLCGGTTAGAEGPPPQLPAPRPEGAGRAVAPGMDAGFPSGQRQTVNPGFTVDLTYDAVWGLVNPGDVITVTRVADGAYGAGEADGVGFFWTRLWHDNGQPADLAGGDVLEVFANGAPAATLAPLPIGGEVEVLSDQVAGAVPGLGAGTTVTVTLGEQGSLYADVPFTTATAGGGGVFVADFSGIAGIGPHMLARVQYRAAAGYTVQGYLYPSEVFRVSNWNGVQGYAESGLPVTVTVYTSYPGTPRWSASTTAQPPHGFYGVYASDVGESIEPGDEVEVDLGGGTLLRLTAGYLDIRPDAVADQITGQAPAGATVRGYTWDSFDGYHEDSDVAGGAGDYTLDLGLDLQTYHWPYAGYADAEGDEVGIGAPPPHIRAYPLWSYVVAVADGPGQPVTYTLDSGAGTFVRYGWCGATNMCDRAEFDAMEPGDIITAELPNRVMEMTVAGWSLNPGTENDEVYGSLDTAGWLMVEAGQWYADRYPVHGWAQGTAVVSPPAYTIPLPGFDVRDGMDLIWGALYDADGHRTLNARWWDQMPQFDVNPPNGVWGIAPNENEVVTATLYTAGGVELVSTSQDGDGHPWNFWFDLAALGFPIQPGQWLTVTTESGWEAGLQVPAVTVQADETTDMTWGEAPKTQVMVERERMGEWASHWVPVDGYVLDWSYFGQDLQAGDRIHVSYMHPNGNRVHHQTSLGELFRAEFWLEQNGPTGMWGEAQPGSTVTVTTPLTQVYAYADPGCGGCWNLFAGDVYPGDSVTVAASPGNDPVTVTIPDPLTAEADSDLGEVWGQIGGWNNQPLEIHGSWDGGYQEVTTGPGGEYSAHYISMPRGAEGYVRFVDQSGYTQVIYHRPFRTPDLLIDVNYAHDWVEGRYEAGHTVWVTLTDEFGAVKATAELQTEEFPWGWTGFQANWDDWTPQGPNIMTGDRVYAALDNGYATEVRVGTISGVLDLVANTISGNVYAGWFTGMLNAKCEVWEDGGPGMDFPVDADGGGYTCDIGGLGWDLQPGDNVAVRYQEPDGDWVINVFVSPWMRVNYGHDWVGGNYPLGHTLWVTVTDSTGGVKATATVESIEGGGWGGEGFETQWDDWSPNQPDIKAGDWVYIEADDGYDDTIHVGDIQGIVDIDADTLTGNIYADWFVDPLPVWCEVWEQGGPSFQIPAVDPDGGAYTCDFGAEGWDLQAGQNVAVIYEEPDDADRVMNVFQSPWMRVNYAHDWVGGNYPAGRTFSLTVTDSGGGVKATATVASIEGGGWGGDGFETQGDDWSPGQPDIQTGDWVYIEADDGYDNAIHVGDIQGTVDIDDDSVGGPIYVGWFAETLQVECHPWGAPEGGPAKQSSAEPDGSAPYFCQWDPNTEWDIEAGQDVAVMYIEPDDADRIINVFQGGGHTVYLPIVVKKH